MSKKYNPRTYGDRNNNTFVETVCDSNGGNCNKNTYYWVVEDPGAGGLGGLGGGTGGEGLSTGGKATLYRRNDTFGGGIGDVIIGTRDSTGPNAGKIVHEGTQVNLPGISVEDDLAYFNKPDVMKRMNGQIKKTIQKGMLATKDSDGNPIEPVADSVEESNTMSNNLMNKGSAIPPETESQTKDLVNLETMVGTRKKFQDLAYPTGIDKNGQDTLKIHMMEYRARKLQDAQGGLGPEKRATGNIIGTVTLPIPGNIKDSDKVEWGSDSMNAAELALAAIAAGGIIKGGKGAGTELHKVIGGLPNINPDDARKGISTLFAGAAIGKDPGKLMSRATGQVMNPNMELLFNGPALRDFSFTFLLAPRSKDEAKNVIKIIRFFKQGMAAIRSKSNLFLKAPHTFQLKYNYKGEEEHKYLNSFKECALKSCDVNYTPENSYSTYEDGVMTAYSLTLAFTELEPIYNDDYGQENAEHLNFSATYDQGDGTIGKTETTPDGRTVQTTIDPTHGHEITTHGNQKTTIYDTKGNFTKEYLMSQTGGGSDIRLKENIIKVNQSPSGLNIYEWNYKSAPNSRYRGVMAQEVMKVVPEAVYAEKDGFLSVYYNLIDVNMELV